jgi:hypothetical protein
MVFPLIAVDPLQPVLDKPMIPTDSPLFPESKDYRKLGAGFVQGAQAPPIHLQ